MLRLLRLKKMVFCDHCDPKKVWCDHCNSKWVCCNFARPKNFYATFRGLNKVCCDHCDSKWVCCDFERPKYLRDFARPKTDVLRLCATQKRYGATIATQNGYVLTLFSIVYVSFKSKSQYILCSLKSQRKTYY